MLILRAKHSGNWRMEAGRWSLEVRGPAGIPPGPGHGGGTCSQARGASGPNILIDIYIYIYTSVDLSIKWTMLKVDSVVEWIRLLRGID